MADVALSQRIVPGAPPPPPLSKTQKKKRKSIVKSKNGDAASLESTTAIPDTIAAALVEKAPEEEDVKKGAVAEELVAPLEPIQEVPEVVQEKPKKTSAAVELLNKRIKVQTKKLSRIQVYSSKPASELNEDQRKSVASLPSIQGAVRELEETKKAIETLEAEETKERERERAEQEKATKDRISQAVSNATETYQQRLSEILSLLRLSTLLSTSDPNTFSLTISDLERQALYIVAETLLGSEGPRKEDVIGGILLRQGDIDGVTYSRLLEVIEAHRNPPLERESTPTPADPVPEPVEPVEEEEVAVTEPPSAIADVVVPATSSGSFHFMQESELEGTSFEHGAEWVEKPLESENEATVPEAGGPERVTVIDTGVPLGVNGVSHPEEPPLSAVSAALDWAAEDGEGLPSIDSLHAKFGTSGAATPEAAVQDGVPVGGATTPIAAAGETDAALDSGASIPTGASAEPQAMPPANTPQVDEDGFVRARGKKSDSRPEFRGRGRGGFRGDRGGEHRGGFRGGRGSGEFGAGWNSNPEFRGRGGFRGDRGRSGEFRGGAGRGGGGRGGEFRGRGRGDRGGHRGGRGSLEPSGEQGVQS